MQELAAGLLCSGSPLHPHVIAVGFSLCFAARRSLLALLQKLSEEVAIVLVMVFLGFAVAAAASATATEKASPRLVD